VGIWTFSGARVVILNDKFRCMYRWLGDASAEMRADLPKVHSLESFEMIEIDSPPPYLFRGNVAPKCSTDTQRQLALTLGIVPQLSRILWKWGTCYFFIPLPSEPGGTDTPTCHTSFPRQGMRPLRVPVTNLRFFLCFSGKNSIHLHPFRTFHS